MKTDEIKSRITIYDILNYYNIKPDRHGFFCCPFHAEKTPSVKLYDSGRWKCFGCGKTGDLIDFVAEYEKTDIPGAIQIISDRFGLELDKPLTHEQKRAYALDMKRREFVTAVNAARKRIREEYAARLSEQLYMMRNELLRQRQADISDTNR